MILRSVDFRHFPAGVPFFCALLSFAYDMASHIAISGTQKQPKEEAFGRISLWTSGEKLQSGSPNPGKISILTRTCRADVHENILV